MPGTLPPAPDDLLSCERCRGFYVVEASDGAEPRVRCNACGHTKGAPGTLPGANHGSWTVIDPDGRVTTFRSREELAASCSAAASDAASEGTGSRPPEASPKISGSALLDDTLTPAPPKLALAEPDSDPPEDDATPLSLRDVMPDSEGPTSAPGASQEGEEPIPLSLRDAIPEHEEKDAAGDGTEQHETVSLKDLTVAPSEPDLVEPADSTPPPPARGVLRTLPPIPPKKGSVAPPPPTIEVSDEARRGAKPRAAEAPTTATATARRPADAAEAPKRSWAVPAVAVASGIVLWRIMAAPSAPPAPEPKAMAVSTAGTTATPAATPTATTPADEAPLSSTPATESPRATSAPTRDEASSTPPPASTTAATARARAGATAGASTDTVGSAEKKPTTAGLSMSDLLDRAGSARRSGDYTEARDLYERVLRQNPGNVEANGGLGDVARAQGDLPAAKASYERALAASPAYVPAQLGLADTEWDLGDRAGAQRAYAQIVERLGERAPERAKQRGGAAGE